MSSVSWVLYSEFHRYPQIVEAVQREQTLDQIDRVVFDSQISDTEGKTTLSVTIVYRDGTTQPVWIQGPLYVE